MGLASRARPARTSSDGDPMLLEQRHPGANGDERRELEHQRQVKVLRPRRLEPACLIGLLESQQAMPRCRWSPWTW